MASAPSSAKDLFVLGRIALRPTYGHDIMRTLASSRADLWAEMSDKHVYYVLRKLERDGLIAASDDPVGSRPTRHMYSITPAGIVEFERLIRSERLITSTSFSDFDVVFGMLMYTDRLSPAEKDALLAARAEHLSSVIEDAEAAIAQMGDPAAGERTHALAARVFSKVATVARAELTWLDEVQVDLAQHGWPDVARTATPRSTESSSAALNTPHPNPAAPTRSDS